MRSRCSGRSVWKTTTLSIRFMNSGENFYVPFELYARESKAGKRPCNSLVVKPGLFRVKDPNRHVVKHIFQSARFISSLGIELSAFGFGWCETKLKAIPVLERALHHQFRIAESRPL